MGIPFHDHCGLCVPGVTLNSFNVATAEFKFVGRAGVPETMKYHFGEIIFRDEFVKGPVDVICFGRGPLGTGEYKVIISIFKEITDSGRAPPAKQTDPFPTPFLERQQKNGRALGNRGVRPLTFLMSGHLVTIYLTVR